MSPQNEAPGPVSFLDNSLHHWLAALLPQRSHTLGNQVHMICTRYSQLTLHYHSQSGSPLLQSVYWSFPQLEPNIFICTGQKNVGKVRFRSYPTTQEGLGGKNSDSGSKEGWFHLSSPSNLSMPKIYRATSLVGFYSVQI